MKVSKIRQKNIYRSFWFCFIYSHTDWCLCSLKSARGCPSRPNAHPHKEPQLIFDGISFLKATPVLFPTPRRSHGLPRAGAGTHTARAVSRLSSSQTLCFPFGEGTFSARSVLLADDGIAASKDSGVRSA